MNIAQLESRHAALTAAHKTKTAEEFILASRGELNFEAVEIRRTKRLAEIAELEIGGAEYKATIDYELRCEVKKASRLRWLKYTQGVWHTKPDDLIDWTKAQRAVLVAFMALSKGHSKIAHAYDYIAAKAGVSRSTAKRCLKEMSAHGLISITERRISRAVSEYNLFTIHSKKLLKWAKRHWGREGVKKGSHLRTLKGSFTTDNEKTEQNDDKPAPKPPVKKCSSNAKRMMGSKNETLSSEVFLPVAKAALAQIGYTAEEHHTEEDILHDVEVLRETYQPGFSAYWWGRFQFKHGKRRTALAFLQTQIIPKLRASADDNRPWNEREPLRNKNSYLWGILNKDGENCRPEITLGALLSEQDSYPLPASLVRAVGVHNYQRRGLGRQDCSA